MAVWYNKVCILMRNVGCNELASGHASCDTHILYVSAASFYILQPVRSILLYFFGILMLMIRFI